MKTTAKQAPEFIPGYAQEFFVRINSKDSLTLSASESSRPQSEDPKAQKGLNARVREERGIWSNNSLAELRALLWLVLSELEMQSPHCLPLTGVWKVLLQRLKYKP